MRSLMGYLSASMDSLGETIFRRAIGSANGAATCLPLRLSQTTTRYQAAARFPRAEVAVSAPNLRPMAPNLEQAKGPISQRSFREGLPTVHLASELGSKGVETVSKVTLQATGTAPAGRLAAPLESPEPTVAHRQPSAWFVCWLAATETSQADAHTDGSLERALTGPDQSGLTRKCHSERQTQEKDHSFA